MPQLDLYTYFTQFQWLLVIFALLFLLTNGQFVSTFQSLFEARNALIDSLQSPNGAAEPLNSFGFEKSKTNSIQKNSANPAYHSERAIASWDAIYEKNTQSSQISRRRTKSNASSKEQFGFF